MTYMEMKVYVSTVVEQDGKILLVQEGTPKNFGKWNLPGGHLELTEKVVDGAKREVLEETLLTVEITSLLGVYNSFGTVHSIRFIFVGEIIGGEPGAGDGIMAVKWFDPAELKNLSKEEYVSPNTIIAVVQDFMNQVRYPVESIREIGNHNEQNLNGEFA